MSKPADAALARFGTVHLVCNNAGIAGPFGKTAWELSDKDWQWVIGVDLWGPIHGVRVFTPLLIAQGEGHIVNTASLAGLTTGTVVPTSYHVAKHGVVALSECLFGDLADPPSRAKPDDSQIRPRGACQVVVAGNLLGCLD